MAQALVETDVQVVLAGANWDVQPPAGRNWIVTAIGSSTFVGVVPNQVPQVDVGVFDGAIGPSHMLRSTDVRGWYREQQFMLSNGNYLRLNNPGAAQANISISAKIIRDYGAGTGIVTTDVQTVVAGATYSIQPPAGDNWIVRDIGSNQWVGAAPAGLPNVTVELNDGTFTAMLARGIDTRMWEQELEIYVDNGNYVDITNGALVAGVLSFIGELIRSKGAGATIVRSDLQNCLALASVDFRPPAGEEWEITGIGAATWVGVSPLAFPAITAHIFDGTNASMIMSQLSWLQHGHRSRIHVDNHDYLRLTDTSNVAQNVGISAVLTQRFAG